MSDDTLAKFSAGLSEMLAEPGRAARLDAIASRLRQRWEDNREGYQLMVSDGTGGQPFQGETLPTQAKRKKSQK